MYNIICADDDKYIQALILGIFTDRGNKVRSFYSGKEALEAHSIESADIIILDFDMPGESGLDLCKELRKDPSNYRLGIIMVSAYDTEEVIVNCLSAGADDYIIKPFKPAELLAKSGAAIENRRQLTNQNIRLEIGYQFAGKYEIIKGIGEGGFSSVFHARELQSESLCEVALKLFETSRLREDELDYMAIFLREAYGLSKLDHPNIVKLHDFGHVGGYYYLAMEYLEGKSLQQMVDEGGAMNEEEVALVAYEISKALQHLELHKSVHRDIKPMNIMVLKNGDIKLIDFGLARKTEDDTITMEGIFKGTPQFAAPEIICMESDIDIKTDIFSLGATLYYLISNVKPFSGDNPYEVFHNRFSEIPKSVRQVDSSISFQFSELIDKMLSAKREDRPTPEEIISITSRIILKT